MKKLLLVPFFLLLSTATFAANTVEKFSDKELVKILQSEGYSSVQIKDEGFIVIKIDGRAYGLLNDDDGDLQAVYSMAADDVSLETINKWNRTKKFSRACLDSDNDPRLESDLMADGGITKKSVTRFFSVFQTSVDAFRDFIRK